MDTKKTTKPGAATLAKQAPAKPTPIKEGAPKNDKAADRKGGKK